MKSILLAICLALWLTNMFSQGLTPSVDPHWALDWSDEFNDASLDEYDVKWEISDWQDGFAGQFWKITDKPSANLYENVVQSNGTVKLHLKREYVEAGVDYNHMVHYVENNVSYWACSFPYIYPGEPYYYTSAAITSRPAYERDYGYYEIRAKVPYQYGAWSAFLTWMGSTELTPSHSQAEIDVFEILGHYSNPNLLKTNVHMEYCDDNDEAPPYNPLSETCGYVGSGVLCYGAQIPNFDANICINDHTQWHTYGLEYNPTKIVWYVDGVQTRALSNPGIDDIIKIGLSIGMFPSNHPNLADVFDVAYEIDYFRYYDLQKNCTPVNDCTYDFNNHVPEVRSSFTVGGTGCTNSLSTTSDVIIRAGSIEIQGEFSVPVGAELALVWEVCN